MPRSITLLLLLATIAIGGTLSAQNLVTNPSFETMVTCPTPTSWTSCQNSPDFFNTCNGTVPTNFAGTQAPVTGNGYIAEVNRHGSTVYHEYFCVPLTSSLVIGQSYTCTMSISLTELSTIGANNMGFQFNIGASGTMNNISQVYTTAIVTDKVAWTTVTGSFVASQAYTHVAIGNFFSDALTATGAAPGGSYPGAYYYIDDVRVIPSPILADAWTYLGAKARNSEEIELTCEFALEGIQKYEVLRATDGIAFEKIGEVGLPSGGRPTYVDRPELYDQPLFYQIRAIDADGNTHTSRIVESKLSIDPNHIRIHPNPGVIGAPVVSTFSVEEQSQVRIELQDAIGNKVLEDHLTAEPGRNRYELNTAKLGSGVYLLRTTIGGQPVQIDRIVLLK